MHILSKNYVFLKLFILFKISISPTLLISAYSEKCIFYPERKCCLAPHTALHKILMKQARTAGSFMIQSL